MPRRFAFIGCGEIARRHADVIQALGHTIEAVASRTASPRREDFVRRYGVRRSYDDWRALLRQGGFDALIVATSWDQTERVVGEVIAAGIPALVEKPVALSARRLEAILEAARGRTDHIRIGYNRRFYDFVPEIRAALATERLVSVEASFPEPLERLVQIFSERIAPVVLLYVTAHCLDLLLHLLGEVDVVKMYHSLPLQHGSHAAYNGLLFAPRFEAPIHFQVNFDAPGPYALVFNFARTVYRLSPIERLTVYDGLDCVEPDDDVPVRRYVPRVARTTLADMAFKPGFRGQMTEFVGACVTGEARGATGATLEDALRVTRLCEDIRGPGGLDTMAPGPRHSVETRSGTGQARGEE